MESTTIQRYIHTGPRKLRLVSDMIRKMAPADALKVLDITPKDAAKDLSKALKTVLANSKQKGMDEKSLYFKKIEIDEGTKMKRFRAGTRGRAKPYKRRMSHIKIVLSDDLSNKENKIANRKVVLDDSADNTKLTKGGETESSKT